MTLRRFLSAVILSVLICALLPPPLRSARAADAAEEVKAVVWRLLDSFAREDLEAVMALWSASSPHAASFRNFAKTTFIIEEEAVIREVRFSRVKVGADEASVRVSFDWRWRDPSSGQAFQKQMLWDISLVPEGGAWKIRQRDVPRVRLGAVLDNASSRRERLAALRTEKELLDVAMIESYAEDSKWEQHRGGLPAAWSSSEIACDIAAVLGTPSARARGD